MRPHPAILVRELVTRFATQIQVLQALAIDSPAAIVIAVILPLLQRPPHTLTLCLSPHVHVVRHLYTMVSAIQLTAFNARNLLLLSLSGKSQESADYEVERQCRNSFFSRRCTCSPRGVTSEKHGEIASPSVFYFISLVYYKEYRWARRENSAMDRTHMCVFYYFSFTFLICTSETGILAF